MKRSIISAAVLSAVFMSAGAFAADDTGTLTIEGVVLPVSCTIVSGAAKDNIVMPDVSKSALDQIEVGDQLEGFTNSSGSKIKFKCDGKNNPSISFIEDGFTSQYRDITAKSSGVAEGVGYKVYLQNERVSGDASKAIQPGESVKLKQTGNGEYELDFKAYYAKTATNVTAGEVNSVIKLQVSTD
ncbi:fimbrial protein YehD [Citrobacter freundii]|uniref:fimbrial protein YehD n=1 Tax=Citrobacter freundii TaxID=546 RepID=UPI0015E91210|nr:fimbrial protein YehD [Citrobacter freundii]QMJ04177.1 fimbrial protein YehD [Citrobacter freundii]QMJ13245.1 fimbrial protein YehD [Citrobacter freundii]